MAPAIDLPARAFVLPSLPVTSRPLASRSLAVLFAINVLNFYDRQTLGALAEPIRKEFHLSDTQLGLLTTFFTVLYAIVGLPFGRLADTWSRKKLLAGGMIVWTGLTGLTAFVTNYAMLVFTRLGVGVGEAVCAPTATSWIGDLYPAAKRARPLALFMIGVPLGSAFGYLICGPASQAFGWRTAVVLAALPAVALVPALLMLREPRRGESETGGDDGAAAARAVSSWSILRIPTLWWIIASGAFVNFNLYTLGTFLSAFLTRFHGLSVGEAGFWLGIGYACGGVLGAVSAGFVGDTVIRKRKDGRMLSAAMTSFLAAPLAFLGILQPAGAWWVSLILISLSYGLLNMYYGLVYASIQDIVAPALRGTSMAIYFMAMYLCGASFGPLITGRLSDMMARRTAELAGSTVMTDTFKAVGLREAMYIVPLLSIALALVLYAGSRTIIADMARRNREMELQVGTTT